MWFVVVQVGYSRWHYVYIIMIILWQFLISCATCRYNHVN
jgi:hypothetical protein